MSDVEECTRLEDCTCNECERKRIEAEDQKIHRLVSGSTRSLADLLRTARQKGLIVKINHYG